VAELRIALTAADFKSTVLPVSAHQPRMDSCLSTLDCHETPLRAGLRIVRGDSISTPFKSCSIGFALSAPGTSRVWFTTAGHCGPGNSPGVPQSQRRWFHRPSSGLVTGVTAARCWWCAGHPSVDVGRVLVKESFWLNGTFGWLMNFANPGSPVKVNGYTLSYQVGDVICLKALHVGAASDKCGIVADVDDASVHHMIKINGYNACDGDSGGAWFETSPTGHRVAYAVHSSSDSGCHGSGSSWASSIKSVNNWNDQDSAYTIRVTTW